MWRELFNKDFDKNRLIKTVREVLEADENVLLAYLFGSCVEGYLMPLSDVDVALLLKDEDLGKHSGLLSELAKALKITEDRIDVANLSKASTTLKRHILKKGLKLVDKGGYEDEAWREVAIALPEVKALQSLMYEVGLRSLDCGLNKDLLKSRGYEIVERVATLKEEILSKSREEILASRLYKSSMERCVHVAIEAILDICRHIVSAKKLGLPETYRELVELASNAGFMPEGLAERIKELDVLRNLLIHRYMAIEFDKLYREAKELPSTAENFMNMLENLINKGC